jgi:hypothetical protein
MRYVREAGSDPAFLLKALGEASGEIRRSIAGMRHRELLLPGKGIDDDWCLMGVAAHMRDVEEGVGDQVELILTAREPEIHHVDLDDIPFREDYLKEDIEDVLDDLNYYRRQNRYRLYDLHPSQWERGGIHPYRGRRTVAEIVRELYQHDLEHLWQVGRIIEAVAGQK